MTSSSALCCLPLESLCLIASQLEGTDRRALAGCCSQLAGAVQLVTQALVLPGSRLPALRQDQGREHTQVAADSWGCACSTACTLDAPPTSALTDDDKACTERHPHHQAPACSWSERYSGVRSLTVTCCDACLDDAAATAALSAGLLSPTPDSPHTPTQGGGVAVWSWVAASCCSPSTPSSSSSSRRSRLPQGLSRVSLGSFLAAAGHSMPYLQELHLATVCPCLHSSSSTLAGHQGGVLAAIAASCPCLDALSVPTWLLQQPTQPQPTQLLQQQPCSSLWTPSPRSSSFSMPLLHLPAAAAASWGTALPAAAVTPVFEAPSSVPVEPYGFERLVLHSRQPLAAAPEDEGQPGSPALQPQQQQQQQPAVEQLSVLSGLQHLTSLKLSGAAPPAAAVRQLAALTRLQRLCVEVTCTQPGAAPASLPDLPGWHPAGALADEHADSSSSISSGSDDGEGEDRSSSGAVLGASLASLTELRTVCLTGVLHAADTLKALSGLPQLVRVELDDLPDFAVASLVNLSGLAHLTALRLHGCRALQATARSALPLQLHSLQELAVLDLDFDLHLRDLQVLCLLKGLSHLTARSFHHCIHLMTGLTLPGLRFLSVTRVSRFALQQQEQAQQQQQQQQQGLPAGYQVVQGPAGPQLAAAAAAWAEPAAPEAAAGAAMPPGVAAAAAAAAAGDATGFAQPAAAAGVPVTPLSALPVLLTLQQQQQQQQGEQPPLMLLAVPGGQALLVQHQPQHGSVLVPLQQPGAAGPHAHAQQQPGGVASAFNLQLLQLRQQQLHLQQQQLRLQQQQVRLQLQQMQAQAQARLYQQAQHHPQAGQGMQAAGAAAAGQAAHVVPQQHGQQTQHQQQNGVAAAAGAACAQPKGWLAVLFPGLEELHLISAKDCAAAVPALQGHQTLQRLVIGSRQPGPPPAQQQQYGALLPEAQSTCGSSQAGGAGSAGSAALYGAAGCGAAVGGSYRGVGAPWGVLKSLASLEELEIHDTAVVLGSMPWPLGVAVSGQLCRLVLRNAGCLSDLSAAALLGPYTWAKLTHLELHGAEALTDRGLNCFSSLPCLETCKLSYCPAMTASGLASFVLNCSSSIGRVEVLCCAGVRPAEAAAVQDAVWGITNRRVEVAWSRHDPVTGRDA